MKNTLSAEYAKIEDVMAIETNTYKSTQLKVELMEQILEKYYPVGVSDLFSKEACEDEWDVLQVYELEKRHAYLKSKISLSWG
jgi:hypothetical protein